MIIQSHVPETWDSEERKHSEGDQHQRNRIRDREGRKRVRKWVSDKTLAEYFEVSRATIWRWVKIGKLPAPEKIGDNCTRWDFEKIQAEESAA